MTKNQKMILQLRYMGVNKTQFEELLHEDAHTFIKKVFRMEKPDYPCTHEILKVLKEAEIVNCYEEKIGLTYVEYRISTAVTKKPFKVGFYF